VQPRRRTAITKQQRSILRALLCLALLCLPTGAFALSGAYPDNTDRFPFVVEVKFQDELICSGTVLYPRIVVTAAHCLQHKVYWRGRLLYVDDYAHPSEITVTARESNKTETYEVVRVTPSPLCRQVLAESNSSNERFAHDLALLITKDPLTVGLPRSIAPLAEKERIDRGKRGREPAASTQAEPRTDNAVLVAFGAMTCNSAMECGDAGVRRYLPVRVRESGDCFHARRDRVPISSGATDLTRAIWCLETSVMPGDSGGAFLIEGARGEFLYLGVISAQRGITPELAAVARDQRSVGTSLYPSLDFIRREARKLGYHR
jgi:hypothetical protein